MGGGVEDLATYVRQNRDLEKQLAELGGWKVLYAHAYYTEEEFWALYDRAWYEGLRQKYRAMTLPSVYGKVFVDAATLKSNRNRTCASKTWLGQLTRTWPFPGLRIACAIRSKDYLIHRQPC